MTDPRPLIRFQGVTRNDRGGYSGVFGLVNRLARAGRLSAADERFRRESNRWYDAAYPHPSHVYERHPSAAAWFRTAAAQLIERVPGYLEILDRHGVPYVVLRAEDPGTVVYEDPYQVVVVPHAVGTRAATAEDAEFCFRLHRAAMGHLVDAVWGWDDDVQRGYHDRAFTPGRCRIVQWRGRDAGLIDVRRDGDTIYLARIEITPELQGHGIGVRLITGLIDEADRDGKDLLLDVLVPNTGAYELYRRLGFRERYRHGDGLIKRRMGRTGDRRRTAGRSAGP